MTDDEARRLLDEIGMLRDGCDLDLLVYFAVHPRCLLSSETLANRLGYDIAAVADSLEALLAAGILERKQTPAHASRLYLFEARDGSGDRIGEFVRLASTRPGRLAFRRALAASREAGARGATHARVSKPRPKMPAHRLSIATRSAGRPSGTGKR
ncbi:MAG: hypothetical protein M3R55_12110 [Acidobacteriota bacterium]|nr:hypothetical protein [Acidobacteriota bacterium]